MIRRVLRNLFTRLLVALCNFVVVWLTARYLGAAGRGAISLFVTDCAAILLFTGIVGGSSLIYLSTRFSPRQLLVPAYCWSTLVCGVGTMAVGLLRPTPTLYLVHLGGLCLLQAWLLINTLLLLGQRRERAYNVLTLLQVLLLAVSLAAFLLSTSTRTTDSYYAAAYVAHGLGLLFSLGALLRLPNQKRANQSVWVVARELARHGRSAHLSNILSFANARVAYYFVAHYSDARALGVLSVGVALAEALWMIPRSTALVQYVDLVHAADKKARLAATLRTTRFTIFATLGGILVLCLLPAEALAAVFGSEFRAVQPIIRLLAPSMLLLVVHLMCSSYFGGMARYRINNTASALGLLATLSACALLIPKLGIRGATVAMSLSYVVSTGYLAWQFRRATGCAWLHFIPGPADAAYLLQKWRARRQPVPTPTLESA